MKDHSKKLNEIKESNESVFGELFGFGKKEEEKEALFKNNFISIDSDDVVTFNKTKSVIKNPLPNYAHWKHIDWSDDNLNWMLDAIFKAEGVELKDNKVISVQDAMWFSGKFRGGKFVRGEFLNKDVDDNNSFVGQFGPGAKWKANPFLFKDGTTMETETILGLQDITNINKSKFNFNIISIPPGNKISIKTQDGKSNEIHVLKRIDSENSNFKYKIKFADSEQMYPIEISWRFLRGNSKGELYNRTTFSNLQIPTLFEEKFNLEINSPIAEVSITPSTEVDNKIKRPEKDKTQEELATTQQHYDLSKVPFLGIQKLGGGYWNDAKPSMKVPNNVGRVYLHAPNNEYLKQFENVVKNLDKQVLKSDFSQLRSYLANKIITGAPAGYVWLTALIGKDTSGNAVEDKNFIIHLIGLRLF